MNNDNSSLFEVLVPTIYGDTLKPIKTRHHRNWDAYVQKITGGLTIMTPAKGKWTYKGTEYVEKVIPVRLLCPPDRIDEIIQFTIKHYRQKAVMYYELSHNAHIIYAK